MKLSQAKTDKPINLLFHDGTVNIQNDREDVFEIDPLATIDAASKITPAEWAVLKHNSQFMRLFRLVFPDIDLPEDHTLQMHGAGVRHVVGLILLTHYAVRLGKAPFWRTPEAHLHPKAQLGLTDLLIAYTKGN